MKIGNTFMIKNRKYKIIDVLKKSHSEQDLILCMCQYGYRECFQRFDLEGGQAHEEVKIEPRFIFKW